MQPRKHEDRISLRPSRPCVPRGASLGRTRSWRRSPAGSRRRRHVEGSMCDLGHAGQREGFGFLVDTPEIRALIAETERLRTTIQDDEARLEALRPAFARLLAAEHWLPERCAMPDDTSRMGGGIGQYALYRAEDGSLCLFSLVVPVGAATPVHDHLAWGLVGIYR